jgi:enamine deaminase RidA (YjgF/YER057c/UK114 family)
MHFAPLIGVLCVLFSSLAAAGAEGPPPSAMRRAPGVRPQRMSRWLVHGSRLETQGLVGDATESVDVQTTQIFAKLDAILEEAGARREDLIHIDVWLRDIDKDFSAMNEVYDEFMAAIPMPPDGSGVRQLPTRVCVGAALSGGFAVELRASAAVWDAAPPKARL